MQRNPAVTNLLLTTFPLIRLTRGEKRVNLHHAWVAAAEVTALRYFDERALPQSSGDAVRALLIAVMNLAKQHGLSGVELADFFNDSVEAGAHLSFNDPDETVHAAHAVLALLAARRLQVRDPIPNSERTSA